MKTSTSTFQRTKFVITAILGILLLKCKLPYTLYKRGYCLFYTASIKAEYIIGVNKVSLLSYNIIRSLFDIRFLRYSYGNITAILSYQPGTFCSRFCENTIIFIDIRLLRYIYRDIVIPSICRSEV